MVRRHLNPEVVWKSDRVHRSGLAGTVGYTDCLEVQSESKEVIR